MQHVWYFSGLVLAAACFALIEIQVEGSSGWAANLPTWKLKSAWWHRLFPGRPLTGYHLYVVLFSIIMAHLPFAFGLPWTRTGEMRSVAFVLFFWVLEDFFWFVFNPHFGVRRFRSRHIPWHAPAWWWIAPRDYWLAIALALVLYLNSRQQPEVVLIAMRP